MMMSRRVTKTTKTLRDFDDESLKISLFFFVVVGNFFFFFKGGMKP